MIDVNVVVGDAVETGAGATIIPISRVSFGFVSGGGEYSCPPQTPRLPFAGGAGTGVSVNPMGFLVVSDGPGQAAAGAVLCADRPRDRTAAGTAGRAEEPL